MTENWLPVPGWEGRYEVSDQGYVRSLVNGDRRGGFPREEPLYMPGSYSRGYRRVTLSNPKRTVKVCRLVLLAFVGPCPPGHQAAHEDGDCTQDALRNLAWKTPAQNNADKVRTDGGWAVDGEHEDEQLGDRSHLFCRSLIRRRLLSADYGFCLDDLVDDEDKEPRP